MSSRGWRHRVRPGVDLNAVPKMSAANRRVFMASMPAHTITYDEG